MKRILFILFLLSISYAINELSIEESIQALKLSDEIELISGNLEEASKLNRSLNEVLLSQSILTPSMADKLKLITNNLDETSRFNELFENVLPHQDISIYELNNNLVSYIFEKTSKLNQLLNEFEDLTGQQYSLDLRSKIYDVMDKNSLFNVVTGLVTFQNFILVSIVLTGIGFVVSLGRDLTKLLKKDFLYALGLLISFIMMVTKVDQIKSDVMRNIFIFDWLTPLFGSLLFSIITFMMYEDYLKYLSLDYYHRSGHYIPQDDNYFKISFFNTIVFSIVSIYHQNWLVGVATIMMLFYTCGFCFGSIYGGFYAGYSTEEAMIRSAILSIILNTIIVCISTGLVSDEWSKYVSFLFVFETGIMFWGTLAGSIAMLILRSDYYVSKTYQYILMQILMAIYCFGLIYFGSVLWISSFKSIGGTFLVLWGLDFERYVLSKFSRGYLTMTLAVILINLYVVYLLIINYREYCIF